MNLVDQTRDGLTHYIIAQIGHFIPDGKAASCQSAISRHLDEALSRTLFCINPVKMWRPDEFNYLHSSQYCQFLYYLSNTIWKNDGDSHTATRLFLLNKALNGIDLFYEIAMPSVFLIGHSQGIVLAKADYGEYLVLYQNSTVGKNHGISPVIGRGVIMYPNTAIIGRCTIPDGTILSAGTMVVNQDPPAQSVVYTGSKGKLIAKRPTRNLLADFFRL